ncbi:hypothetical protein UFOVP833_59 [uncultured Caudovirales phage]|uniref:Uncharacterized protein n=1 Tax=uncultured Caudovirales phage TaxID=2100421 RepID=A0A6J5SSU4_9CAUD|nr:hypothetical protein UFOVP833_59 [uncultured Caudovirales phage]CAB4218379.1 hypothetical protein UFOVP1603_29 [uncultured Caudovirales phage]
MAVPLKRLAELLMGGAGGGVMAPPTARPPLASPQAPALPPFHMPGSAPVPLALPDFEEPGGTMPLAPYMQPQTPPPMPPSQPTPPMAPMQPASGQPTPLFPPDMPEATKGDVMRVLAEMNKRGGLPPAWLQDSGNLADQTGWKR